MLEVERDDLIVAVDLVGADAHASEVEYLQREAFGVDDVYLGTVDVNLDILEFGIHFRSERCRCLEIGQRLNFGLAGVSGHSHADGKKCQNEYVFLHLEVYFSV